MSDLAHLPPQAAFVWPTPPLPGFAEPAAATAPEPCTWEDRRGRLAEAQLLRLDVSQRQLALQEPCQTRTTALTLDQLRLLRWSQPLQPDVEVLGEEMLRAAVVPVLLHYKGSDTPRRLDTLGHARTMLGWVLFEPVAAGALAVRRVFVPHEVLERVQIGVLIGEALVEQKLATPAQVQAALAEQEQLRQRRLGELLVAREIVTRAELEEAIEQQARMPMVRIGEALVGLKMLTPEQLEAALAQQRRDRGVPLGELLVRRGVITREDLQTALSRKMGYPLVDVDRFPVEAEALGCLPQTVAARAPALPLMRRQGRLVVALEDPTRKPLLQELEFAAQHKLVPVLARAGALAAAVPRMYAQAALQPLRPLPPLPPSPPSPPQPALASPATARPAAEPARVPAAALSPVAEDPPDPLQRLSDEAAQRQATHIHLEGTLIRLRIGGALQQASCSAALGGGVAREWLLARMTARRGLQDQALMHWPGPHGASWHVQVLPALDGPPAVVLTRVERVDALAHLQRELPGAERQALHAMLQGPPGLLLCVAPNLHASSALLHAALACASSARRTLRVLEDPPLRWQPGVHSHTVAPGASLAPALRQLLAADADVIGVGHEPDRETVQALLRAVQRGQRAVLAVVAPSARHALLALRACVASGPAFSAPPAGHGLPRELLALCQRGSDEDPRQLVLLDREAAAALM